MHDLKFQELYEIETLYIFKFQHNYEPFKIII